MVNDKERGDGFIPYFRRFTVYAQRAPLIRRARHVYTRQQLSPARRMPAMTMSNTTQAEPLSPRRYGRITVRTNEISFCFLLPAFAL